MVDLPKELKVNPNTVVGTTYSQLAGVIVTDTDITLEFVYINPRVPTEGVVVSRVTLPKKIGLNLANTINLTVKKHDEKSSK
ncbi:MAG: hypothetical protein WC581_14400 [Thermodesulfovibrionales bacterium]